MLIIHYNDGTQDTINPTLMESKAHPGTHRKSYTARTPRQYGVFEAMGIYTSDAIVTSMSDKLAPFNGRTLKCRAVVLRDDRSGFNLDRYTATIEYTP